LCLCEETSPAWVAGAVDVEQGRFDGRYINRTLVDLFCTLASLCFDSYTVHEAWLVVFIISD